MTVSQRLMENCYDPGSAPDALDRRREWEQNREVYMAIAETLNCPVRDDPSKAAALLVFAKYLFKKRNVVAPCRSFQVYARAQTRSLPRRAHRFFPEIVGFLKNLDLTCPPEAFDRAVIQRLDGFLQALDSERSQSYLDLQKHFLSLDNCATPLDFLLWGLFNRRAIQNLGTTSRFLLVVVLLVVFWCVLRMR